MEAIQLLLIIRTRLLSGFFNVLYNQLAWLYDIVANIVSLRKWKSWVLSILPDLQGPMVLEIGHGPGHLLRALADLGVNAIGIDNSSYMTRIAFKRVRVHGVYPSIVNGLAQSLPFPSDTFDQIVSTFPSAYIFETTSLNEIRRVLLPGGKFIVLPVAWITGATWVEKLSAWLFKVTGQSAEDIGVFEQLFARSGFLVRSSRRKADSSEVLVLSMEKWKS